jgi:hypothetical protein
MNLRHNNRTGYKDWVGRVAFRPSLRAEAAEFFLPDTFQEENFSLRKKREQDAWLEVVDHDSEYSPYDDGRGYYAPKNFA